MTKAAAFFAKAAADYKSKYVLGFYEEEKILFEKDRCQVNNLA